MAKCCFNLNSKFTQFEGSVDFSKCCNANNRFNESEEPVIVTYNFDVENLDWSGTAGVTDQASFESFLTANTNYTSITVTDFVYSTNRIQCNVSASGGNTINFIAFDITSVNIIGGGFDGLLVLNLPSNQIVNFDPSVALPDGLTVLDLDNNQIVNFDPSIELPNTLNVLVLNTNQIVTFDPTLVLPSSLTELVLVNNQIVTFDPSIALPNSLTSLNCSGNLIVSFNPSIELPITLTILVLSNNQMTTAGYITSETWANNQTSFTSNCAVDMSSNIDSVSGTDLETTLISKNCTVTA